MNGQPKMNTQDDSNLSSRLARVESVVPYLTGGGKTVSTKFSVLDSGGVIGGKLNLATPSSIHFAGIMAPSVVDGALTIGSSSTTTAQIFYDGANSSRVILIRRADGTVSTIPPNNVSITGLTAGATYQAFSYWSPFNQCALGWSPGDTGTPLIAFSSAATATMIYQAISNQGQAGREPIASVKWTQPSSGSTSPTPPSPSDEPVPGLCVMLGTKIEPLGDIRPDEWQTTNHRWEDWVRIETSNGPFVRGLNCTPNHPLYDSEKGKVEAEFFLGKNRWIITEAGEEKISATTQFIRGCTKVHTEMKRGHLFWANGFLSHNFKTQ
jgi:hypothetical protein